jgi:hypothetical protein
MKRGERSSARVGVALRRFALKLLKYRLSARVARERRLSPDGARRGWRKAAIASGGVKECRLGVRARDQRDLYLDFKEALAALLSRT